LSGVELQALAGARGEPALIDQKLFKGMISWA